KRVANGEHWQMELEALEDAGRAQRLAAIVYTEKEHGENPFTQDNRTLQTEFTHSHDDVTVEFYEREAKPVALPFEDPNKPSLGGVKAIHGADKELVPICDRAREILIDWQNEKQRRASEQLAQIEALKRAADPANAEDPRMQGVRAMARR